MALGSLRFRPWIISDIALLIYVLLTIPCIILLGISLSNSPFQGSPIFFDGLIPGYIATAFGIAVTQQVIAFSRVLPYIDMASATRWRWSAKRTILGIHFPFGLNPWLQKDSFALLLQTIAVFAIVGIQQLGRSLFRREYAESASGGFVLVGWAINPGVCIGAIVCLIAFDAMAFAIAARLHGQETGLAGEPGSIVMLLGMVWGAKHIWEDFQGLDIEPERQGFWDKLSQENYCIYPDESLEKYVLDKDFESSAENSDNGETPPGAKSTCINMRPARFDYIPDYLRTSSLVIYTAALFGGFVTALSLSLSDNTRLNGLDPLVSTEPLPYLGLSPADFLWSFVPAFIANQYMLTLLKIDIFYRTVQPYADLHYGSATFETLEINYHADPFPIVTIKAIKNRHWKVALSSILSTISSLLPVYAASLFYIGHPGGSQEKRILIAEKIFRLAMVTMGLLSMVFLALIPTPLYFMPHPLLSLADHLSFLYKSSLLEEEIFTFAPDERLFKEKLKTSISGKAREPSAIERKRFAMGVRKACVAGKSCGGPHGICIDVRENLECYYTETERQKKGWHWGKFRGRRRSNR